MATPKGKVSKARRDSRRSAHWKLSMPGITKCPRCGKMKLNHRVCKECGYYDGQQIVHVEADAKYAQLHKPRYV